MQPWPELEWQPVRGLGAWLHLEQARQAVRGYSHAGHSDWRLPSLNELKTVVYCSTGQRMRLGNGGEACDAYSRNLAFVESAFPDTPASGSAFWSGSPYDGTPSSYTDNSNLGWFVEFRFGSESSHLRNSSNHVRLVRGGQ